MGKGKVIFNNCSLSDLEKLIGYEIIRVSTMTDASAEGFIIEAKRKIDNVAIGIQFMREEDIYYLSDEYVIEVLSPHEYGEERTNRPGGGCNGE